MEAKAALKLEAIQGEARSLTVGRTELGTTVKALRRPGGRVSSEDRMVERANKMKEKLELVVTVTHEGEGGTKIAYPPPATYEGLIHDFPEADLVIPWKGQFARLPMPALMPFRYKSRSVRGNGDNGEHQEKW